MHTHVVGPLVKELVGAGRRATTTGRGSSTGSSRPALDLLKIQVNPIPIKAALNELGHQVGGYRLPLVEPTEDELAQVRSCLERLALLRWSYA